MLIGIKKLRFAMLILSVISVLVFYTALATVSAETNFALQLNGSPNYVNAGRTNVLMGGTGWLSQKTISFWIAPSDLPGPSVVPTSGAMIISTDRPKVFGITRAIFDGADRIWVWNVDANGIDTIGITFETEEWMHLAIVHDGVQIRIFKNGDLVASMASGPTILPTATNDGTVYLGGSGRSDLNTYFRGKMDEVRFWNTALSQQSIQEWMNREISSMHPRISDLSAYFKMNTGIGTQLIDESGNGHDGVLLGGMGDQSWVISEAFEPPVPTETLMPTETPLPPTDSPTPTETPLLATITSTLVDTPTPTETSASPTDTPTPTETPLPKTDNPHRPKHHCHQR